jgi:hypothetical protein
MARLTGQDLIHHNRTMKEHGYGVAKIALDAGYDYYDQSSGLWKIAYTSFYEELLHAKGMVNRIIVKVTRPNSTTVEKFNTTINSGCTEKFKVMRAKDIAGYGAMKCDRNGLSTSDRIILNCRADKTTIVIEVN